MIDFEKLKNIYKFNRHLSLKDVQLLLKSARSKSFSKKELLIEEGTEKNEIFIIRKGLVRCYYVNDKGEEITFQLIPEHYIVANADIILFKQASRFNYEAFEATQTYSLEYDVMQSILESNIKFESNRKYVFQKMLKLAHRRIESFVLHNPEERYLLFIKDYPNIVNRVPDKYIANVLGITPVSLSRIRKRIAEKK
jgi:CRP-like cAMP-binding protein